MDTHTSGHFWFAFSCRQIRVDEAGASKYGVGFIHATRGFHKNTSLCYHLWLPIFSAKYQISQIRREQCQCNVYTTKNF